MATGIFTTLINLMGKLYCTRDIVLSLLWGVTFIRIYLTLELGFIN